MPKGELRLLNFLGVPDFEGLSGPEGNLMYGTINEAWRFHHYGFRLHSLVNVLIPRWLSSCEACNAI